MSRVRFIRSALKVSTVSFGAFDIYTDQIIFSTGLAEKELGYTTKELNNFSENNFEVLIHPEDLEHYKSKFQELLISDPGEIVEYSVRVKKADGNYLSFFIRDLVFERGEGEKPTKFVSMIQNITDLVELEHELDQKVEALRKVAVKNAHDVRAPVANILGLVDLMSKESFKTEYHEKIFRHLVETVNTLDQVIHEINDLSSK